MPRPFWDVEENIGFVKIKSNVDSLEYKVYNRGTSEDKQKVADTLAKIRRDLNKLLFYLCRHPEEWIHKQIALGIFLTLEIHMPCINYKVDYIIDSNESDDVISDKINMELVKTDTLFSIQEMTPNEYGIIGLNKPKGTKLIKLDNSIEYEVATKRTFHLTVRNKAGVIDDYSKVIDLALHEITHTVCNDNYWKENNHEYPFNNYHSFIKKIFSNIK